jgi:uncharacterized membrane protein
MARIVERNIHELLARRQAEEARRTWQERLADAVTTFAGSLTFVFLHLALFGGWILWNAGWLGLKPFDPSFVVLAMFASVEAIFLSTFVLISQIRMSAGNRPGLANGLMFRHDLEPNAASTRHST